MAEQKHQEIAKSPESKKQINWNIKIYHLEQISSDQHLYLVEQKDGKLFKMGTNELIEQYPKQLT